MSAGLALRLLLLPLIVHPGIADPNHYYNVALRLLDGQGFTIDYIWQYNRPPDDIVHPEDHWMPFTAALAASGMALGGRTVHAALLPFMIAGVMLAPLAYALARQFGCGRAASLFTAACATLLPELVLASLRTDTTVISALLVPAAASLLTWGLRSGRWSGFIGCGALAGLAYLTRNDGALLLPMAAATLIVYAGWGRALLHARWWRAAAIVPAFALVIAPWIVRNVQVTGSATTPEADDMFFFTQHEDHYAYGRSFTLATMLAAQTPGEIVGKRVFEAAAAVQVAYSTLDQTLPVLVAGGLLLIVSARDRQRLLTMAPALVLLLGLFAAYPILIPYKSQAGSFKKAYLALVPLLLPLGAYALERVIANARWRTVAMLLIVLVIAANAFQFVRTDARLTAAYLASVEQVAAAVERLPDRTGDGEIRLMTQDPFMLRFVGLRSVMFPSEPREVILDVARRYRIDYLLLPAARAALDDLLLDAGSDPRFLRVHEVPGTQFVFFALAQDDPS